MAGNTDPIHTFGDFATDVIKERMERVSGVGRVDVYGGGEREMRIVVDPAKSTSLRRARRELKEGWALRWARALESRMNRRGKAAPCRLFKRRFEAVRARRPSGGGKVPAKRSAAP